MSERLTKKQLKRDRFIEIVYTAVNYVRDHVGVAIGGVIALIAIIALGVKIGGSSTGVQGGNSEAEKALAAAAGEYSLGRSDEGLAALQAVRTEHRGSRAAREATYLLGNAFYESGDYAQAKTMFEDFLKKPLYDDLLADGARFAIAACSEELGDLAGAAEGYGAIWNAPKSQPAMRIQAGLAAARCARFQGDKDRAIQIYDTIIEKYPVAPEAAQARFESLLLKEGVEGQRA
jgi:TolA-binding protein